MSPMKLWRISQDANSGYDTFSDAIVAAETEELAKSTHPDGSYQWIGSAWQATRPDGTTYIDDMRYSAWVKADQVEVEYIGEAKGGTPAGVICASFHAG